MRCRVGRAGLGAAGLGHDRSPLEGVFVLGHLPHRLRARLSYPLPCRPSRGLQKRWPLKTYPIPTAPTDRARRARVPNIAAVTSQRRRPTQSCAILPATSSVAKDWDGSWGDLDGGPFGKKLWIPDKLGHMGERFLLILGLSHGPRSESITGPNQCQADAAVFAVGLLGRLGAAGNMSGGLVHWGGWKAVMYGGSRGQLVPKPQASNYVLQPELTSPSRSLAPQPRPEMANSGPAQRTVPSAGVFVEIGA